MPSLNANVYGEPPRRRGFTLIELLVVVAIIALLISLLIPALEKAKQQTKMVRCAGHMYQVANLVNMYATSFSDFLPSHQGMSFVDKTDNGRLIDFDPPVGKPIYGANYGVTSYLEALACTGFIDPTSYWYNNSYKYGGNCWITQNKLNAFNCPSAMDRWSPWDAQPPTAYYGSTWGYGFTTGAGGSLSVGVTRGGITGNNSGMTADSRYRRKMATLISSRIMMSESGNTYGLRMYNPWANYPTLDYVGGVHLRHMSGKMANYLFADSHVEASDKLHKYSYANLNTDPGKTGTPWYQPE